MKMVPLYLLVLWLTFVSSLGCRQQTQTGRLDDYEQLTDLEQTLAYSVLFTLDGRGNLRLMRLGETIRWESAFEGTNGGLAGEIEVSEGTGWNACRWATLQDAPTIDVSCGQDGSIWESTFRSLFELRGSELASTTVRGSTRDLVGTTAHCFDLAGPLIDGRSAGPSTYLERVSIRLDTSST